MGNNPDKILSETILDMISKSGIVSAEELMKYSKLIANGKMGLQDWILLTEPSEEDTK